MDIEIMAGGSIGPGPMGPGPMGPGPMGPGPGSHWARVPLGRGPRALGARVPMGPIGPGPHGARAPTRAHSASARLEELSFKQKCYKRAKIE